MKKLTLAPLILFIFSMILAEASGNKNKQVQPQHTESEKTSIRVLGTPGLEFFGVCMSADRVTEKQISGTVPKEVNIDYGFQKCELKGKSNKGKMNVRVFYDRRLIFQRDDIEPSSGVEFVIPFGKKPRQ